MVIVIVRILPNFSPNTQGGFQWRMEVAGLTEAHSREFIESFGLDRSGFSFWKVSDDKLSITINMEGDRNNIPIPQAVVYLNRLQTMQCLKLVASNPIVTSEGRQESMIWTLQHW